MEADTVVFGKIFTSDDAGLFAEGFAVKDGRIAAVGSKEEIMTWIGISTDVRTYPSGIIVPGFTEGHAHISSTIELTTGPFVHTETIEECLRIIKDFADAHPQNETIEGGGFDPGLFGPAGPTAKLLDSIVPDRPVILSDEGHHSVWVNTAALKKAGITRDTPDPESGQICHDENGEPSGFLQEMAIDLITPALKKPEVSDYKDAILHYQQIGLSNGIVTAFEPMLSHSKDEPVRMDAYEALDRENQLKITYRVAQTLNPADDVDAFYESAAAYHERFKDREKIQVNTIKFFMDGVVDGHTALLREPYKLEPLDCGPLMIEQQELNVRVERALREGFSVHIHAIGDAAIDEALNAYEYAQSSVPGDYRNAITHLQVCTPDHPKRMKELNVVAVVNPYWHFETPLYKPLELPFLGKERAEHMYYLKSFLDEGIVMSQASDFPVTVPPDTMFCLHMMVNRFDPKTSKEAYFPEECIDVISALKVLTIGGAYENFLEDRKGSITEGKDADFVVLSQDVTGISRKNLYKTKVLETWIGGECCYVRTGR